jgi:D-beta-D-heptose 7-phosphate kinase/D-beta-D-heptose 1-phosphate adenosyltransferase
VNADVNLQSQHILGCIENDWPKLKILVVGDAMLDKYVWGRVERLSPEAPVPIVHAGAAEERPGGAANAAMNLAALGLTAVLCGYSGADEDGRRLETKLSEAGVAAQLVRLDGVPTISKTRIIGGHQQMLRLDCEDVKEVSPIDAARLLERAMAEVKTADALVLSDYAKGALQAHVCRELIDAARSTRIPVLVDPKHNDFRIYRGATTVCPNLKELSAALGAGPIDLETLLRTAQQRLPEWGLDYLTVTLSESGIAIVAHDSITHLPARARAVFDVSGAGDTAIATIAAALASGLPIQTACRLANLAAGHVTGKVGTALIFRHELVRLVSVESAVDSDDRLLTLDQLVHRVGIWRETGETIVFTNGCYDLLHIGHVRLLEEAKKMGDHLVVGLNSDASVRRLKGSRRPAVREQDRARILAALAAVDAVVIFDEDTPLQCIEAIRPNVLVKGGDYIEQEIVGAREVRSWQGQVRIVPTVEGCSTTRLIAAIATGRALT